MKLALYAGVAALALVAAVSGAQAQTRDQIRIVGSSTVFPYTQAVAEQFAASTGGSAPVVESTGTGGGMQIFCGGVGVDHPDITGASRAMKKSEFDLCVENGVDSVTEVLIGFDGLSVAHSQQGPELNLTKAQIFQALASEVEINGEIVANPYKMWNEIDASLPATAITVFGPPPTSGTRDAWVELVMETGCKEFPAIKALDATRHAAVCKTLREDGAFIEAGENDNVIVQRLDANPKAYGIFGFSYLEENQDKLKGVAVNGVAPSYETIASQEYPISRPLFMYFKNQHMGVIPGLKDFLGEYASERAMGDEGYLADKGLIPLPEAKRKASEQAAMKLTPMAKPAS